MLVLKVALPYAFISLRFIHVLMFKKQITDVVLNQVSKSVTRLGDF